MTEFYDALNKLYEKLSENTSLYTINKLYKNITYIAGKKKLKELDDESTEHFGDIKVTINEIQIINNMITINSSLGSFYLLKNDNRTYEEYKKYSNKEYSLEEFYNMLKRNDLDYKSDDYYVELDKCNKRNFKFTRFIKSFEPYYWYKVITDNKIKQQFKNLVFSVYTKTSLIPYELLCQSEFNDFSRISVTHGKDIIDNLNTIYSVNPFLENKKLIFSLAISLNDKTKLDFINNNFEEFKKFVKREGHIKPGITNNFLLENDLYSKFTEDDLLEMYMNYPNYIEINKEVFGEIANKIVNKSKLVNLDSTKKQVHINYMPYDLYDGIPVKIRLDEYRSRDKLNGIDEFEIIYLMNLKVINKLYNAFYEKYKSGAIENDNIKDFLENILTVQNISSMYTSVNITAEEIKRIEKLAIYFNPSIKDELDDIKIKLRKSHIALHNSLLANKDNKEELIKVLKKYGISEQNFRKFIIENKFFDKKEKEALLGIYTNVFGNPIRIIDILSMMDEMLERNLTLSEILEEKNLPEKEFNKIYNRFKTEYNTVYETIREALNENKRRGYIKLIKLGYVVLNSKIKTIDEYEERFGKTISFDDLLEALKDTELYDKLTNKFNINIESSDKKL